MQNIHQNLVLVVEDEALIAIDLEEAVCRWGYAVTPSARTRSQALHIATEYAPQIALIDGRLADGPTGGHVADDLHERGIFCIPITGNPELFEDCNFVVAVITKPFSDRALKEALEKATLAITARREFGHGGPNHVS